MAVKKPLVLYSDGVKELQTGDSLPSQTLDSLSDVIITTPVDQSPLIYDSASGNWVDGVPSSGGSSLAPESAVSITELPALNIAYGGAISKVFSVDATHDVFFTYYATATLSNIYATVFDKTANLWGTPVLVYTVAGSIANYSVEQLTATAYSFSIANSTTSFDINIITVSGTTVTVGAVNQLVTTIVANSKSSIISIGSTFVFCYSETTVLRKAVAFTVSGTTITFGTIIAVSLASSPAYVIDSTTLMLIGALSATSQQQSLVTVSGTTLTVGATN